MEHINKDKKLFKNKIQMIIYLIIFCLLVAAFIYLGRMNFKKDVVSDQEKFDSEFSMVNKDNVFTYINSSKLNKLIGNEDVIVLFGTNSSEWVDYYAKIVNDCAKTTGINSIYYYDFIKDRKDKNANYESILNKLQNYLKKDDTSSYNIYAPTLLVMKGDRVLFFDDETSFIIGNTNPNEYWEEYKVNVKTSIINNVFREFLGVQSDGE